MATDDQKALEFLRDNPSDPRAGKVAQILGLTEHDVQALEFAKTNPADMRAVKAKEIVAAKVANFRPPVPEQGVTDDERWNVNNLLDTDPKEAVKYLSKQGYQTKNVDGELFVRKPGDANYKVIDPDNSLFTFQIFGKDKTGNMKIDPDFSFQPQNLKNYSLSELQKDQSDMDVSFVQGGIEAAAEAAPFSRWWTVPAATFGTEMAKQGVAKATGVRDEWNVPNAAGQAGISLGAMGVFKGAGKLADKASDGIGYLARKAGLGPKANAPEIMEAAKTLGVDVQPSQILEGNTVRNIQEGILDRTFRPAGAGRRASVETSNKTAREAAESIVADRSGTSAVEAGTRAAAQITEELSEKIKPAEEIYEAYESKFKFVTVPWKQYRDKIAQYGDEYKYDKGVQTVLNDIKEVLPNMRDLTELKKIRTTVGNMIRKAEPGTDERRVLSRIYGDLTELRTESLLRRAKGDGESFYAVAKKEIGEADRIYRESVEAVADVLGRGRKVRGSPKASLDTYLEKTREFDLTTKIFDLKDPVRLASIQKSFPKTFDILRKQKVEEIAEKSMEKGAINFKRLASNINNIPDESLVYLFGKGAAENKALKAQALKVLADSIPHPSNPSGTAGKVMRGAGDVFTGGALYTAGLWKAIPILAVPEVWTMLKGGLLDIISNPVTRKGFLLKLAKAADNPVIQSTVRAGARNEANDFRQRVDGLKPPTQSQGLTIPGR